MKKVRQLPYLGTRPTIAHRLDYDPSLVMPPFSVACVCINLDLFQLLAFLQLSLTNRYKICNWLPGGF